MLPDLDRAKIVITNYHAFMLRETMDLSKGGRALLQGRGKGIATQESEGQMLQRVMPELMGMKHVVVLNDDWERMVAFYDFPEDHWKHLRTTNVVESPFAAVRLRTTAAKRFKRVESATALIWKLLLVAEKRFRRLDAPHLLKDVFEGRKFEDGKPVSTQQRKNAA